MLFILSFYLIYSDTHNGFISRVRNQLTVLSYPVQWLVDAPIRLVSWVGHSVTFQQKLIQQNAKLRANELLLQSKLQKVLVLQRNTLQHWDVRK